MNLSDELFGQMIFGGKIGGSSIVLPFDFQGNWNATTNIPALVSGTGTKNYAYIVSVAGNTNLDGITDWQINDIAWFTGTIWLKIDNSDLQTLLAYTYGYNTTQPAFTANNTPVDLDININPVTLKNFILNGTNEFESNTTGAFKYSYTVICFPPGGFSIRNYTGRLKKNSVAINGSETKSTTIIGGFAIMAISGFANLTSTDKVRLEVEVNANFAGVTITLGALSLIRIN